ncbi:MAG TPA: hypothetical protein VN039_14595 [Nitrospira sp.]|nr:hypothetical protein [Nitrospira sp.]
MDMRDAAARAVIFQIVEQEAKKLKDEAKAELAQMEPGDTLAGKWGDQLLGKATMTSGRTKLVVTDEEKLITWLQYNHPEEILLSPNPAYMRQIEERARKLGVPVDGEGEAVPAVSLEQGEPYVSVRKTPDAPFVVAELLSRGRVQLDGIKELEQ